MFLVLKAAARAEGCVMRLDAECFKQRIRAQIRAQIRAEKRQLQRNNPRFPCPR